MTGFVCKIIKTQRCQPGDFFSDQHSPPPLPRPSSPIRSLPPPPHWAISRENSIYQGLQVVEYSSNQTLAYIGVTKKKFSSICLQRTTSITQENEARNRNTSIRSQMISDFWNIRSLNLIFSGQLIQTFFYLVVFGHLYGRAGDCLCIRETQW